VIKPFIAAISVLLLSLPTVAWGEGCVDWPRVMSRGSTDVKASGTIIVVKPFTNFTKNPEDDWLKAGYPELVASLLGTSESARVLAGNALTYDPAAAHPRYIVEGTFQHPNDTMRIFIEVKDGVSGTTLKILTVDTPYPDNAHFFTETAEAAREIGTIANITFTEKNFNRVRDATASTRAYENYARGRQALATYQEKKFEIARIWFEQVKKADFQSWLSYEGLIDLYTFLGLRAKLTGKTFIPYYQKAEEELAQMNKLARRPPVVPRWGKPKSQRKKHDDLKLTNRFLKGNAAYLRGVAALKAGDTKAAEVQLRKATEEVPEDAIAWTKLATALSQTGKAEEAARARNHARRISSCL